MTAEEKEKIRRSLRYNQPLRIGLECFINEEVLNDEEYVLYKDFLGKTAKIINTVEWNHSIIGSTFISELGFDGETFDKPIVVLKPYDPDDKGWVGVSEEEYLAYQRQADRFKGYVRREILKVKE